MKNFHHKIYHVGLVEVEAEEEVDVYCISMNNIYDADLVEGVPSMALVPSTNTFLVTFPRVAS